MTVSLFFAVPFAAAAVVLALCFVGCDIVFSIDEVKSFSDYTPSILDEPTLSAYWRLGEPPGATTAVDLKAGHNGTYLSQVFPDDPPRHSAAAPGLLTLGQPGIVGGDTVPPDGARSTCIEVNGGSKPGFSWDGARPIRRRIELSSSRSRALAASRALGCWRAGPMFGRLWLEQVPL